MENLHFFLSVCGLYLPDVLSEHLTSLSELENFCQKYGVYLTYSSKTFGSYLASRLRLYGILDDKNCFVNLFTWDNGMLINNLPPFLDLPSRPRFESERQGTPPEYRNNSLIFKDKITQAAVRNILSHTSVKLFNK